MLFLLACAGTLMVAAPLSSPLSGPWADAVVGTVASLAAFALTLLFVRWERLRLEDVGAAPGRRSVPRFALGFLVGLLLVALSTAISAASGYVRWVRAPQVGLSATAVAVITYLVLALREELAFRGYPLRNLDRSFGTWVAQTAIALAFALEHMAAGWTWSQALFGAGVGSLLFGMAALATRGLAVPVGLHAAWNLGDWMRGGKSSPGLWRAVVEEGHQERARLVGTVGYLAVMGLGTLVFWAWQRRVKLRGDPR